MKTLYLKAICIISLISLSACEDFIAVNTPDNMLDTQAVFSNEQAAQSALNGLFNQLFNTSFSNGGAQSVSYLTSLSADNLIVTSTTQDIIEFYQNDISTTNNFNLILWSGCYNIIYQANLLLEGVNNNQNLPEPLIAKIEGSARFVRAFTYFYLINLYGEVPLILQTDYQQNATAKNTATPLIYDQIILDLEQASALLAPTYEDNDRTRVNQFAAKALLARVHLFLNNWEAARSYSSEIIAAHDQYELLAQHDQVFLANSREAIWQISPIGWGNSFSHTRDGNLLIKTPTNSTPIALSKEFLNSFYKQDLRKEHWTDSIMINEDYLYYPYKYKVQYDYSGNITEYSMVLRLAEQYLIQAEANIQLNKLEEAIKGINALRERSGIPKISNDLSSSQLLDTLLVENRRELFNEWGHRWLALKRYDKKTSLNAKPNTNFTTDAWLYPIPYSERVKNPNLTQNPGY